MMCSFWLFFAVLTLIYLVILIALQIPLIPSSPAIVLSSIVLTTVMLGVAGFQHIGLYLICKRGVLDVESKKATEGFRRRRW